MLRDQNKSGSDEKKLLQLQSTSLLSGVADSTESEECSPFSQKKTFQGAFHSGYSFLKKALGIEGARKAHIDSLLKKCKSKCIKAIHEAIKLCVSIKVNRLPQCFITNIKIDGNKAFLSKTIEQIYVDFGILPTVQELYDKNSIRKNKHEIFRELMSSSFHDMFATYIESKRYLCDLRGIQNKEGKHIASIFNYIACNFCKYYEFSKGNRPKRRKLRVRGKLFQVKTDLD